MIENVQFQRTQDGLNGNPVFELAQDVTHGLTEKEKRLPSKYLYDTLGSRLFEAICELSWYKITRGEKRLLEQHGAVILSDWKSTNAIVELGSGSGEKLSMLLNTVRKFDHLVHAHLVDISSAALELSKLTLSRHPSVSIFPKQATYESGLRLALSNRNESGSVLVLFLGSNISNLHPQQANQLLQQIQDQCRPGDRLLLGADLVKPEPELLLAYDDPLGITAAFNLNILVRLNNDLGSNFNLNQFKHLAIWNEKYSRIELYLESQIKQVVYISATDCYIYFSQGERILTENSYKYQSKEIIEMGKQVKFKLCQQWIDEDSKFTLTLFERK